MELVDIRNFAIIAHIDHGKSTLADRLIEYCGGLEAREMSAQVLDSMDIERERGITIKAQTVRLHYKSINGRNYVLNLVDTPGHVDFTYEVSRSLAACEGSVLVVDASQGVEAQTLANVYKAIENNHEIVPVINKIDLPAAEPQRVKEQIENIIGLDVSNAVEISAKTGLNIRAVLEAIVEFLPPPQGNIAAPLKALLIDSWYDSYLGVVILVRIKDGLIKSGMRVKMLATDASYTVDSVGIFTPKKKRIDELASGEIGFVTASIKCVSDCKIGDTITEEKNLCDAPLEGFKPLQPVVFCGLYPVDAGRFPMLREGLIKLRLNDSSFTYEMENSGALGLGFRCGFLGLLHLEIVHERLEREFNLDIVTTAPGVIYKINLRNKQSIELHNPFDMPDPVQVESIEEPWITATLLVPEMFLGLVIELCIGRRGEQVSLDYSGNRVLMTFRLPLNEVVYDFYDELKSRSRGYASFSWEVWKYRMGDLVKVTILVHGESVDALSMIVHRDNAESRGREVCLNLKKLIPRHQFVIPIQAAIGGRIVARETLSAFRKDVTAKLYGGDVTRKMKLLEKQKKGKKRMRAIGKVHIPQSAFIAALRKGAPHNK